MNQNAPHAPYAPQNDTIEEGHLEVLAADSLAAIERSQIDTQISTAKKYPRSVSKFLDEAQSMISLSPEIAEGCNYKLKRKNADGGITYIEGPSVRLLEIAASAYGNLRYGSRTIGIDEEFVTAQGMAFDMERNVASSVEVKRSIKGKRGRYSNDMIMITSNAAGSIARRNALNGVIPRVYIQALSEHAKKVALGDIKTLPERRQRAFDYFTKTLGVPVAKVLEYLEKQSVEDCNLADVSDLQDLKTALKDGMTTLEETFNGKPETQATGAKPPLEPKAEPEKEAKAKAAAPLPSEGPSKKGPKPEPKPKPEAAATPLPEPPKEEPPKPQPKEDPKAEPAKDPEPQPEQPQPQEAASEATPGPSFVALQNELDHRGVSFDDFTDWLVNSGRYQNAKTMKELTDLPADRLKEIMTDEGKGRPLDRCLKIFGTK